MRHPSNELALLSLQDWHLCNVPLRRRGPCILDGLEEVRLQPLCRRRATCRSTHEQFTCRNEIVAGRDLATADNLSPKCISGVKRVDHSSARLQENLPCPSYTAAAASIPPPPQLACGTLGAPGLEKLRHMCDGVEKRRHDANHRLGLLSTWKAYVEVESIFILLAHGASHCVYA